VAKHTKACAWWAGAVFSREGAVLHENLAEENGHRDSPYGRTRKGQDPQQGPTSGPGESRAGTR
jgi:hypothetical protein